MTEQTGQFAAGHYEARASAYVESTVHSQGADLEAIVQAVQGRGLEHVLDLGCGGGHVSYAVAPHVGRVMACDITPGMLRAIQDEASRRGLSNIEVRQAPAENLPFEDAAFDAVLCRFTAHHWDGFEAGLREARRVLKPGGQAVFVDVTAPEDAVSDSWLQTLELMRDISHVRDYSVEEWVGALGRSGFSVEGLGRSRLRMAFGSWVARTQTPAERVDGIRSLQRGAPAAVKERLGLEEDGSFLLDVTVFTVHRA
ncbi:class I SAM-dependent methyltransferase [Gluconobacter japonicus]|uniref:class I SAM-dependent methyltransferase n=1 Tax=Gluconobacter japonicus TaxID=376620 RepID=UPI000783826A|nr:methyltransferase domain-containing protein [Gluconobacter japonicus]KXV20569.1 SAM-dependent methyltransferase [Gluconobacter japonicus]